MEEKRVESDNGGMGDIQSGESFGFAFMVN